jgi:hypothetical protein
MVYKGGCHCGRVSFEVEGEIPHVLECNCSICSRKGSLLWFVPRERLRVATPDADISTYTFNRKAIRYRFCPVCGMHPFGEGIDPSSGKAMAAINVRCLEGVDLGSLRVQHFDGRAL